MHGELELRCIWLFMVPSILLQYFSKCIVLTTILYCYHKYLSSWIGMIIFYHSCHSAWCYIRLVPRSDGEIDRPATILAQLLGYELWVYITFVALLVLYLTMLCYLKYRVCSFCSLASFLQYAYNESA